MFVLLTDNSACLLACIQEMEKPIKQKLSTKNSKLTSQREIFCFETTNLPTVQQNEREVDYLSQVNRTEIVKLIQSWQFQTDALFYHLIKVATHHLSLMSPTPLNLLSEMNPFWALRKKFLCNQFIAQVQEVQKLLLYKKFKCKKFWLYIRLK